MASWSSDTYYFMPLEYPQDDVVRQEKMRLMLSALAFKSMESDFYGLANIQLLGPAICITGCGRWWCGPGFTEESWNVLNEGVVICETFINESVQTTIRVNGECVFEHKLVLGDGEDAETTVVPWTLFEGRNEKERRVFEELKSACHSEIKRRRVEKEDEIIERELMRLKLKREGRLQ